MSVEPVRPTSAGGPAAAAATGPATGAAAGPAAAASTVAGAMAAGKLPPRIATALAAAGGAGGGGGANTGSAGSGDAAARGRSAILFSIMLALERSARRAPDIQALRYVIVNDTRRLLPYRQAVLAEGWNRPRPVALSDVPGVERTAPYVTWIERVLAHLGAGHRDRHRAAQRLTPTAPAAPMTAAAAAPGASAAGNSADDRLKPQVIGPADLPDDLARAWPDFAAPTALLCPLADRQGHVRGWLWLARDQAFGPADQVLAGQLTDAYAHAWLALAGRGAGRRRLPRPRWFVLALLAAAVAAGFIPVPQTVLAPAEVSARDPATVASPLDGVIADIIVEPNQRVEAGDVLLRLDDTNLRAEVAVARRTLEIAEAELRRARQGAFNDRDAGAQIALLEARARLKAAELDYAQSRLDRVVVAAERPGLVLFTRADDWTGRPVQTGQRIMTIANPDQAEIRIELPVGEAIRLEPDARVQLFLDARPLEAVEGRLSRQSYMAEQTPSGVLAYDLKAALADGSPIPRVGLRGTAKIYGADVPLAFYLFRRPLAALRQKVGY
ncbi:HlyD family efflux transporter periplasmic adaptor subunit [Tistrella bauzanensis]|uniref:efflux RND transporter periplasmic adaptor subunit n=1 Tax=Tistrella TaxID=171436 RepID=UPI0031F70600